MAIAPAGFREVLQLAISPDFPAAGVWLIDEAGLRTADVLGMSAPSHLEDPVAGRLFGGALAGQEQTVVEDPQSFAAAGLVAGAEDGASGSVPPESMRSVTLFDSAGVVAGALAVFGRSGAPDAAVMVRLPILASQLERLLDHQVEHSVLRQVSLDLKNSERSLHTTVTELRDENRELDSFADFTAHELRSPLRSSTILLDLIERELALGDAMDTEAIGQHLQQVRLASVTMQQQVEALLRLAQLSAESLTLAEVDLREVAIRSASLFQVEFETSEAELVVDPGPAVNVVADENQLLAVFNNLFSNALRYRDPARPLAVRVAFEEDSGRQLATAQVIDNGLGIDESDRERVFAMFARLSSSGDGLGLGLALCRRIVRLHEGTMGIGPNSEQGATFWFRIPRKS